MEESTMSRRKWKHIIFFLGLCSLACIGYLVIQDNPGGLNKMEINGMDAIQRLLVTSHSQREVQEGQRAIKAIPEVTNSPLQRPPTPKRINLYNMLHDIAPGSKKDIKYHTSSPFTERNRYDKWMPHGFQRVTAPDKMITEKVTTTSTTVTLDPLANIERAWERHALVPPVTRKTPSLANKVVIEDPDREANSEDLEDMPLGDNRRFAHLLLKDMPVQQQSRYEDDHRNDVEVEESFRNKENDDSRSRLDQRLQEIDQSRFAIRQRADNTDLSYGKDDRFDKYPPHHDRNYHGNGLKEDLLKSKEDYNYRRHPQGHFNDEDVIQRGKSENSDRSRKIRPLGDNGANPYFRQNFHMNNKNSRNELGYRRDSNNFEDNLKNAGRDHRNSLWEYRPEEDEKRGNVRDVKFNSDRHVNHNSKSDSLWEYRPDEDEKHEKRGNVRDVKFNSDRHVSHHSNIRQDVEVQKKESLQRSGSHRLSRNERLRQVNERDLKAEDEISHILPNVHAIDSPNTKKNLNPQPKVDKGSLDTVEKLKEKLEHGASVKSQTPKPAKLMFGKRNNGSSMVLVEDIKQPLKFEASCVDFQFPDRSSPLCVRRLGEDGGMSDVIKTTGLYEPALMSQMYSLLKAHPSLGLVDIGAGIGVYTISAALMGRQVIAVEPFFKNFRLLHKSADLNKVSGSIVLVTNVLGNGTYVGQLTSAEDTDGLSTMHVLRLKKGMQVDRQTTVKVTTLDNLLSVAPFKEAVLKIDTPGDEAVILENGAQFLNEMDVPYVLCHWMMPANQRARLMTSLTKYGYVPREKWDGADISGADLKEERTFVVWAKMKH